MNVMKILCFVELMFALLFIANAAELRSQELANMNDSASIDLLTAGAQWNEQACLNWADEMPEFRRCRIINPVKVDWGKPLQTNFSWWHDPKVKNVSSYAASYWEWQLSPFNPDNQNYLVFYWPWTRYTSRDVRIFSIKNNPDFKALFGSGSWIDGCFTEDSINLFFRAMPYKLPRPYLNLYFLRCMKAAPPNQNSLIMGTGYAINGGIDPLWLEFAYNSAAIFDPNREVAIADYLDILHELGHVHQLPHVVVGEEGTTLKNLMHAQPGGLELSFWQRLTAQCGMLIETPDQGN
jgi:hypothetical protein